MSRFSAHPVIKTVQAGNVLVQTPSGTFSLSPREAQDFAAAVLEAMAETVQELRAHACGCGNAWCSRGIIDRYEHPRICERCESEQSE